jgi:hypothetical protein
MNNVYLYWVGNEYKLIKILKNLIYLHSTNGQGYKVNLINDKNIKDYINYLPDNFYKLSPVHQADVARVCILCDKGGLWLDSDTIIVDKLDDLFDIINNKDGFFIKEGKLICNGIFGTKPNTNIMKEWKDIILNKIKQTSNITGTELGSFILHHIRNKNPDYFNNYHLFEGSTDLYPVIWNVCVNEFLEKPYDNYKNIEKPFQPLVILVNRVYKALENKSLEDIMNGNRPLNYFIEKSYRNKFKDLYLIYKK